MRQNDLYRAIIDPEHKDRWEASFTFKPTTAYLQEALECDISELEVSLDDPDCDESDSEILETGMEGLLVIREILQILSQGDQTFWDKHGWNSIFVAGVKIGRTRIETSPVFIEAEE
jgi:hypothetical protein